MRYRIDEVLIVTKDICGHGFKIGTPVRIVEVNSNDYKVKGLDNQKIRYCVDSELVRKY